MYGALWRRSGEIRMLPFLVVKAVRLIRNFDKMPLHKLIKKQIHIVIVKAVPKKPII